MPLSEDNRSEDLTMRTPLTNNHKKAFCKRWKQAVIMWVATRTIPCCIDRYMPIRRWQFRLANPVILSVSGQISERRAAAKSKPSITSICGRVCDRLPLTWSTMSTTMAWAGFRHRRPAGKMSEELGIIRLKIAVCYITLPGKAFPFFQGQGPEAKAHSRTRPAQQIQS